MVLILVVVDMPTFLVGGGGRCEAEDALGVLTYTELGFRCEKYPLFYSGTLLEINDDW